MAELTFEHGVFYFRGTFQERQAARAVGMRFDKAACNCYTTDLGVAVKLREYATGNAKARISRSLLDISPWTLPLPPSPPGLKRLWFQNAAVRFALSRNRSYLGLPPGLGKTICAATIARVHIGSIVYVSPPFLVRNVQEEFSKWASEIKTCIYPQVDKKSGALIVPDSLIMRPAVQEAVRNFCGGAGLLIVDEAHRFKAPSSKRSKALFSLLPSFPYQLYMSGTPMPNRPMELYPILSRVAPETIDFMSMFDYGRKFCAAHRTRYGWDFSGASNMKELAERVIGTFMYRVKKDVLGLPPKTEEVFIVSEGMSPRLAKLDSKVKAAYGTADDVIKHAIAAKEGKASADELHVSTYLKLLGEYKAKFAVEYVASLLEETDESIILYGHHKGTIERLVSGLAKWRPFLITGATPSDERHEQVKAFQTDAKRRLFIGSYRAMGVGFTLTKATRVIFAEYSYVPGENEQAADRAHRKGQTSNVLVQYLTYANSIDREILKALLRKQEAIRHL